jgi:hypothetical protein
MGLDVLSGAQLYMCSKRQYDDSFPQKRCLSVSTTRAIRTRNQEAEKFGSLKYFEVHIVQEK